MMSSETQLRRLGRLLLRPRRAGRRAVLAVTVAGAALLGGAATVHANWSTPVVISDGTQNALYPRVATRSGPGDEVHVVWRNLAGTQIEYRRSSNGGQTWFPIMTLYTGSVASDPHIAAWGNSVHIVWEGPDSGIKYLRSTSNGGLWDPIVSLSLPGEEGYAPDVAAHVDHVSVVWVRDGAPDVAFKESHDNGHDWEGIQNVTADGAVTEESGPRVAVWNEWSSVAWVGGQNVSFRRKGGFMWDFPIVLWVGEDPNHVSIAAYESHVFVDRNHLSGPWQRLSVDYGATFNPSIPLGTGDEKPEISASKEYAGNGATVFLDERDGFFKIFFSDGPLAETQIDTITGGSRNADIGAMKNGAAHVVKNSSGLREVSYQKYTPPPSFRWWWKPVTGVGKSDAQWGDIDGDGDLDLVISGDVDGLGLTLATEIYENVGGLVPLVLKQSLVGVQSESSGNLAWGDYDNDGDLDLVVAGASLAGPIASIYENDGSGVFTLDAAQSLTAVSLAATAWGDYDNDGDLDLVVTGSPGAGMSSSTLYENDPAGTLTAHTTITLTDLRGGSADWGDIDNDGDMDLLVTGFDGTNRRVIFYENDPPGTLSDTGSKLVSGVTLSDTAFGDFDGDGDIDLICTGDAGAGGPRVFEIHENDGFGNFTMIQQPMTIYRSSGAWGDYDNDGDMDLGLCGYDGVGLYTRIYGNAGGMFGQAPVPLPGVRDGSITWADVDQDGKLDFFMTGWDWTTTYADLYEGFGGELNTMPSSPTSLDCAKAYRGMQLLWSGASDPETATTGLYYALRVGTGPGAHDVLSGTYATPLMGNVGQATDWVLDVPSDTYYWSVRAIDSGLTASDWTVEETCQYCRPDFDDTGTVGFADLLQILGAWGPCNECLHDLDRSGDVGFADLLILLGEWGTCP